MFLTPGWQSAPPLLALLSRKERALCLGKMSDSRPGLPHRVLPQLLYDPDECGLMKMALLYFSDFWNKLDIAAILLFIAGLTCRRAALCPRGARRGGLQTGARAGHPPGPATSEGVCGLSSG